MENSTASEEAMKRKFLIIGKLEGYSYLILLFVAMPLKYYLKQPQYVLFAGSVHGILFVSFIVLLATIFYRQVLDTRKSALAVVLSLVPFGTFYLKRLFKNK